MGSQIGEDREGIRENREAVILYENIVDFSFMGGVRVSKEDG